MSSAMDPINLVLLAVAAIVMWRLWSVLGTRTGTEKPPIVLQPEKEKPRSNETIAPENPEVLDPVDKPPVWKGHAAEGSSLASALEAIAARIPGFTVPSFLRGATIAYEMVLEAYANDNRPALKNLLSREMLDSFTSALDARKAKGHAMRFQFVGVKNAVVHNASLTGNKAVLEVDLTAEMISATLDRDNKTVDGDEKSIRTVTDRWSFERDVTARDPNWKLVATDDYV